MGTNLQSELEPLLAQLRAKVDFRVDAFAGLYKESDQSEIKNDIQQRLSHLIARFHDYYTLDGPDLHLLSEDFLDPSVDQVDQKTGWQFAPGGRSVYSNIASAASIVVNDVGRLIGAGWAGIDRDQPRQWSGEAAEAFRERFLNPFMPAAIVHGVGACELAAGAKALATNVELVKRSVVWICKKLIQNAGGVVDSATGQVVAGTVEYEDPGPAPTEATVRAEEDPLNTSAAMVAIAADTVALLLAVLQPEFAPLEIGLAVLGVGGGLVAESAGGHLGWFPTFMDGGNVHDWLASGEAALDELNQYIAEADDTIWRGLEEDFGPDGPFGGTLGRLDRTDLRASDYDKFTGGSTHTPGIEYDALVLNYAMLYRAGYLSMHDAAASYGVGTRVCADAQLTRMDKQFPKAVGRFNDATRTFGTTLTNISQDLKNCGEALMVAAESYHGQDTFDAQQIKSLEGQIQAQEDPDNPMSHQYHPVLPEDVYPNTIDLGHK